MEKLNNSLKLLADGDVEVETEHTINFKNGDLELHTKGKDGSASWSLTFRTKDLHETAPHSLKDPSSSAPKGLFNTTLQPNVFGPKVASPTISAVSLFNTTLRSNLFGTSVASPTKDNQYENILPNPHEIKAAKDKYKYV